MVKEDILMRYLDALLQGNRLLCREVIEEALQAGIPANRVYVEIVWPIMVEIEKLYRTDRINSAEEHLATRINHTIVNQLQNKLPRRQNRSKKIVVCCGPTDSGELGGQMIADLFESDGWEVRFLGGGASNDDILGFIHSYSPDILLIYGAVAKNAPDIRRLIDTVRNVNAWPNMRIMLSGGLFNRAEGLWQEIGADLFAETAAGALRAASEQTQTEVSATTSKDKRKRGRRVRTNLANAGRLKSLN